MPSVEETPSVAAARRARDRATRRSQRPSSSWRRSATGGWTPAAVAMRAGVSTATLSPLGVQGRAGHRRRLGLVARSAFRTRAAWAAIFCRSCATPCGSTRPRSPRPRCAAWRRDVEQSRVAHRDPRAGGGERGALRCVRCCNGVSHAASCSCGDRLQARPRPARRPALLPLPDHREPIDEPLAEGVVDVVMARWAAPPDAGRRRSSEVTRHVIHAIQAGTVAVKTSQTEARTAAGAAAAASPALADRRWTDPLPILAWLIEHPGF